MKRKLKFITMFGLFIIFFMTNQIFVQARSFDDIKSLSIETQQEVVDLTSRNIIKGTTPTTFSPSKTITRGQVVKLMGRYIEQTGIAKVNNNWEEFDRHKDIPLTIKDRELLKYSTLLNDLGIFTGDRGRLYPSKPITREQMALTLERLMVLARGYSLIDYAYDLESHVVDLQKSSEEARPYIKALNALEISKVEKFNPKSSVKRVQFASFFSRTINLIDREHHVIHFKKTAKELGFQEISNVSTIKGSNLNVHFSTISLHIYARYDGEFSINEEVIIKGTNLFGRPHESRMRLYNDLMGVDEFRIIDKYIPGSHARVPMNLFLMHSYTSNYAKELNSGRESSTSSHYKDEQSTFMNFQRKDTGIFEFTINGNVMSINNGEITRTPKTVQHRYYLDYQGVMIMDTDAMNYIGDKRYEVTNNGDVLFEGKQITDREFYYLPLVRPIPFVNHNDFFGGFTFTDDVTLEEILAFHKSDGQKSSIPKQYMHPSVLVIDGDKNIYGTVDLRKATFGQFEFIKNY